MSTSFKNYLIGFWILILLSTCFINSVLANTRTAASMHPDVWGYDLSNNSIIPSGYNRYDSSYKAPNGDTVLEIVRCLKNCEQYEGREYEFAMLWFFAGKVDITKDPVAYVKEHQLKNDPYFDKRIEIANGECIKRIRLSTGKLCQVNDLVESLIGKGQCAVIDNTRAEYDMATNRVPGVKRYSIIGASGNILRGEDKEDGYCDRGGPGGGEITCKQLYPVDTLIGLGDGTFLILWGRQLIRFDSNFKTKFINKYNVELFYEQIIKGDLYILPYEKIEELKNKVAHNNEHQVQGLHDELLLYLYRRPENR